MRSTGPVLDTPSAVRRFLWLSLAARERECFAVLFLDNQHQVIADKVMFAGTLTHTSVYPREVARRALAQNAAAVIFAHNRPSGCAEPSEADIFLMHSLKQALAVADVRVLDHFIRLYARRSCAAWCSTPCGTHAQATWRRAAQA